MPNIKWTLFGRHFTFYAQAKEKPASLRESLRESLCCSVLTAIALLEAEHCEIRAIYATI